MKQTQEGQLWKHRRVGVRCGIKTPARKKKLFEESEVKMNTGTQVAEWKMETERESRERKGEQKGRGKIDHGPERL